jgi:hypothetical protein
LRPSKPCWISRCHRCNALEKHLAVIYRTTRCNQNPCHCGEADGQRTYYVLLHLHAAGVKQTQRATDMLPPGSPSVSSRVVAVSTRSGCRRPMDQRLTAAGANFTRSRFTVQTAVSLSDPSSLCHRGVAFRFRSVHGPQTILKLDGRGLRHTLASHGCRSRGNPVGR